MAIKINNLQDLNNYITKVIEAADHAPNIASTIPYLQQTVLSRFIWGNHNYKIEIYSRNGNMARTCWLTLNNKRYVFTYNYTNQKIDLKMKSLQGNLIADFDNSSSLAAITNIINTL